MKYLSFIIVIFLTCSINQNTYSLNHEKDSIELYKLRAKVDEWKNQDSDSTIHYSKLLIKKASEMQNTSFVYKGYYWIINIFGSQGLYDSSLHYAFSGVEYFKEEHAYFPETVVLTLIGEQYRAMAMYDNALFYLNSAITAANKINDKNVLGNITNRLASVYLEMEDNNNAIKWADSSIKICELDSNLNFYVSNLNIKGAAYRSDKKYKIALESFMVALRYGEEINEMNYIIETLNNIAVTYALLEEPIETIKYAQRSYDYSSTGGLRALSVVSSELLATAYSVIGDYKRAYEYARNYENLRGELFFEERDVQISELNARYETSEKEKQIEIKDIKLSQQESELKQGRIIIFLSFLAAALLLVFLVYRLKVHSKLKKAHGLLEDKNEVILEQKKKQENIAKELNKSLNEKELLLEEIHHRVKNSLQLVSSLLELQSKDIHDEKALESIHEGQERVRAIALIHQKLYQNENLTNIDFNEYTTLLTNEIKGIYQANNKVNIDIDIVDLHFDIDTAIPLGLILNELITNAFKYAFNERTNNTIDIAIKKESDTTYLLSVMDNGLGLPENIDISKTKSLGLRLVKRLTKQLHGSFDYQCKNGSVFNIVFKDTNQRQMS